MPKEFMTGARGSVAQMGDRMYRMVAGSSRPERVLKDEVFRLCDTMTSKEVGAVLGKVYVKLGATERTAHVADYMKDLYGVGSRRLFVPPVVGGRRSIRVGIKPMGMVTGDLIEVQLPKNTSGMSRKAVLEMARRRAAAKLALGGGGAVKPAAFAAPESAASAGGNPNPNEVVTLQSVADYCLKTANRYEEVKPVYDMLVELFSEKSCPEWTEIKAAIRSRMETLPGKSYITVNGTYVEQQHIQNNVEKVEDGGEVVMEQKVSAAVKKDGRKNPTRTGKIVSDVYEYLYFSHEEAGCRIAELHRRLVRAKWLDSETKVEKFEKLFSGVPDEFHLKWIGAHADLCALIKCLLRRGLIKCPAGATQWVIARSHFKNKAGAAFSNWNRQKDNQKTQTVIEMLADILDPAKEL